MLVLTSSRSCMYAANHVYYLVSTKCLKQDDCNCLCPRWRTNCWCCHLTATACITIYFADRAVDVLSSSVSNERRPITCPTENNCRFAQTYAVKQMAAGGHTRTAITCGPSRPSFERTRSMHNTCERVLSFRCCYCCCCCCCCCCCYSYSCSSCSCSCS